MSDPDLQPQPGPPEARTFEAEAITLPATDWQALDDFCRETGGDLGDWVRFFAQPDASWRRFPGSRTLSGRLRWLADYVRRRPQLQLLEPGQLPADVGARRGNTIFPDEKGTTMSRATVFVESYDLMRRNVGDLFGPGMLLPKPARPAPSDRAERLARSRRLLPKLAYPGQQMRLMILADWLQENDRAGDAADVRLAANHASGSDEMIDHQLLGRLRDLGRRLLEEDVVSFAADIELAVERLCPLANSQTRLGGKQ